MGRQRNVSRTPSRRKPVASLAHRAVLTIPLAGGRELELTRERGQPVEAFRVAVFHRYGAHRMSEGGFVATRAELRLLSLALDAATFPEPPLEGAA